MGKKATVAAPPPKRALRVTQIRARNILGLRELALEPGKVTVARGSNGVGKTSLLRALEIALYGASGKRFPTPVHLESEDGSGEVVLDLEEIEITRAFRRDKEGETRESLEVRQDGAEVARPQAYLSGLLGPLAFSPIAFAAMAPRDRRETLVQALALRISPAEVAAALPAGLDLPEDIDWTQPALDVLDAVRAHFYTLRHGRNQERVRLQKTIAELSRTIPETYSPADPAARAAVMAELSAAQAQSETRERIAREVAQAERQAEAYAVTRQGAERRSDELATEIAQATAVDLAPIEAEVRALEAGLADARRRLEVARAGNARRTRAEEERAQLLAAIERVRSDESALAPVLARRRAALAAAPAPAIDDIRRRLAELDSHATTDTVYRERESRQRELVAVQREWEPLEAAVVALSTTIPRELIARSQLPIPGLEIDGDEIRLDGKSMSGLCGRERLLMSLTIAQALAGDLKVICADACEMLDPDEFDALVAWAQEGDFQLFLTRVSSGPLQIETLGRVPQEVA